MSTSSNARRKGSYSLPITPCATSEEASHSRNLSLMNTQNLRDLVVPSSTCNPFNDTNSSSTQPPTTRLYLVTVRIKVRS